MKLHSLLQRQLKRLQIDPERGLEAGRLRELLESVGRVYEHADDDRYMLERSLAVSSEELQQLHDERRRLAEAHYGALVASVPGAVYRCRADAGRTVEFWSDGFEALVGCPPSRWAGLQGGRSFWELVWPEDRARVEAAVAEALARRQGFALEYRVLRASGEARWVSDRGHFFAAGDGEGYIGGILMDDSARRLSLDELEGARVAAERATEAKSAFLANMSHELRTPLNAVIGLSGLLLEQPLSSQAREMTEMLRRSGESLLELIDDVLDFSKIEANRLELERVDFDLRAVVDHVLVVLGARAAGKGLELGAVVAEGAPRVVRGDPGRIRQILMNFTGNAVKFTRDGYVRVSACALAFDEGVATVRFEVTDTGPGIPASAAGRMFKPFSQADASATRQFGGTGLGLAICRTLARLMGGEVGYESELGAGSKFWLELPLPVVEGPSAPLAGRSLAVVDPSHVGLALLADQVASFGADVLRFDSVREARAALGAPGEGGVFAAVVATRALLAAGQAERGWLALFGGRLVEVREFGSGEHEVEPDHEVISRPVLSDRLLRALLDPHPSSEPRVAPRPKIRSVRALVVEDNPINQRVISLQLERLGVASDLAADGEAALEALSRRSYAVIFMDCQMPVLDGFETTRRLRQRERASGRRSVVIALTAHAVSSEQRRCFEAGMDDFISKPVSLDTLGERLERWLAPRTLPPPPPPPALPSAPPGGLPEI